MTPLEKLRQVFPWPDKKPDVPPDLHGWFAGPTREMLDRFLPTDGIVLELGTWLGMSASYLVERAAHVICVDHWQGSPEHHREADWKAKLPTLYETCVVNLWEHREKITLLKVRTLYGLAYLSNNGIAPALIYVDADHSTEAVMEAVATANHYWPHVPIVGDDYTHDTVRVAVAGFEDETGRTLRTNETAYAFEGIK